MNMEINDPVITCADEIRKVYTYYRQSSKEHLLENPSDHYRVDRCRAVEYFGIFPKWKEKILNYFASLKKKKQKIVYVDICGRASAKQMGADISYLFSLRTDKFMRSYPYNEKDVFVDGSIFEPTDFSRLIKEIRLCRISPSFVTFMPMAGLHSYTPLFRFQTDGMPNYEAITYSLLEKRLKQIIKILKPGGYIMIERPFQFDGSMLEVMCNVPKNNFKLSLVVKKLTRKLKCRVEISTEIGGPYFLIHKPVRD